MNCILIALHTKLSLVTELVRLRTKSKLRSSWRDFAMEVELQPQNGATDAAPAGGSASSSKLMLTFKDISI